MSTATPTNDRLLELLADDAVGQLDDHDRDELDALLDGERDESMELAAAAAAVAMLADDLDEMPVALRRRLDAEATRFVAPAAAPTTPPRPAPTLRIEQPKAPGAAGSLAWLGWLAAAACLALAVVAWWPDAPPSLEGAMDRFLATHASVARAPWSDWSLAGVPPEVTGVTGEVVWSEADQQGYLRLVGLPANDPAHEQYQLWIVDERGLVDDNGQSARISGAIFDATGDETIVPIDPAIPVHDAALFAVTIEKPGGVWASDMTRRVVVATVGG